MPESWILIGSGFGVKVMESFWKRKLTLPGTIEAGRV
jgi:hypothetical protein